MGFLQGYLAGARLKMQRQAQGRAMQQHQMNMQLKAIQLRALQREEMFQVGAQKAAQEGGFPAVLDFYKNSRPRDYFKLKKLETDLNNSITQGTYHQALGEGQQLKNLQKSQEVLGNLYGQILQLPENQQNRAYQANMENIKQLDSNAPANFNKDRALMAIGQAIPAAQLYQLNKASTRLRGTLGDAIHNIHTLKRQGLGENSQEVQAARAQLNKIHFENAKIASEIGAKKADREAKKTKEVSAMEDVLRKEFVTQSKDFVKIRTAHSKLQKSIAAKSPAGDLSSVFMFMKMLDPESVVRESEFATAQNTTNTPRWLMNMYNAMVRSQTGLTEGQRKDFKNRVEDFYESHLEGHKQLETEYGRIAKDRNIDPKNVIVDYIGKVSEESGQENSKIISSIKQFDTEFNAGDYLDRAMKLNPGLEKAIAKDPKLITKILNMKLDKLKGKK
jgi:hypothetical protein